MVKHRQNSLGVLHAAISDTVARNVLGALSPDDFEVLSRHAAAGTLVPALQHLIEHDDMENAIAAMPDDVGQIARKVPSDALLGVKASMADLPRNDDNSVGCGCH